MAKIDELLKQKEELEKEIEREKKKEIEREKKELKISTREIQMLTHFLTELFIPPFLANVVPENVKMKIDSDIFKEENKSVIKVINLTTQKEYLTITLKGE